MQKDTIVKFWFESAKRDKASAESMFTTGEYHWSLFVWHLALEKFLKGLIVEKDKEIVKVHNLSKLAEIAEINLSEEQKKQLFEINGFNLSTRYSDYKNEFYKKATKEYAQNWNRICKKIYIWLQTKSQHFQKNK